MGATPRRPAPEGAGNRDEASSSTRLGYGSPGLQAPGLRARATLLASLLLLGCGEEKSLSGLGEPVRVRTGVFREGELPGTPPSDAGAPAMPTITSLETASGLVAPGQGAKAYLGRASTTAYSVGVRLAGLGTGWWMVPVGGADPSFGNELTWQFTADFGGDLPPGLHALRFVAIDGAGRGGAQRDVRVCVLPAVPDNLHACDPTIAPPDTVVSLAWDVDADLDLVVVTPEGDVVDGRRPTTAAPGDGGVVPPAALNDPSTGVLDRNSNGGCHVDRIRRENVVWQGPPRPGVYRVYVNLFDACRQPAVRYRVTVTRRRAPEGDAGAGEQFETVRRDGVLGALAANGGARLGTFVTELSLP